MGSTAEILLTSSLHQGLTRQGRFIGRLGMLGTIEIQV